MKRKQSEEHIRKRSEALKGKKKPPRTEGHRRKLSEANKGKKRPPFTEETKQKIRGVRKDKTYEEIYGVERAQEERKKRIEYILQNGTTSIYGTKGKFYSHKNQKDIRYDSLYELRAYEILEQDERIKNYDRCRFSIDYTFKDGIHKYIPDIHIIYLDDTREILEVKSKYLLEAEDEKNKAKFKAARKYCSKNNQIFSVWTETEIRGGY